MNKKIFLAVWVIFLVSCFFLLIRFFLTSSTYYFFLIWNLFLAIIPLFWIYFYLKNHNSKVKYIFLFISFIFWPNSIYIITDFVHLLRQREILTIWFDIFLLFFFSFFWLMIWIISLFIFHKFIEKTYNYFYTHIFVSLYIFLSCVWVFIWRFLRFNSWDIISNPIWLIKTTHKNIFDLNSFWFIFMYFFMIISIYYFYYFSVFYFKNEKI